jgi:hypothetical protein
MNNESKSEIDYTKERLDAHSVPWTPISSECIRITVRERSYYYYPTRKKWRVRGSNRQYDTHSIDHLIKFLSTGWALLIPPQAHNS